jgi:hypothetical protein
VPAFIMIDGSELWLVFAFIFFMDMEFRSFIGDPGEPLLMGFINEGDGGINVLVVGVDGEFIDKRDLECSNKLENDLPMEDDSV